MASSGSEDVSNSRNANIGQTAADFLKEKKAKLKKDIRELEELNFHIECSLNISKFGDVKHLLKSPESAAHPPSRRIPDVETEYVNELFQLAGICCTKWIENEYVFSLVSSGNCTGDNAYSVQITNASEEPKVSKWVMPMSVDMSSILLDTPLQQATDLKPFLANCKHHIDCYTNRVQQYNELKPILNDLSGCWLDSNIGKTVITLKFFGMQLADSDEVLDVILYLIYESNRARPHKIKIDPLNLKILPEATVNKFKSYFKYFKCFNLQKAFVQTIDAEDTSVIWTKGQNRDVLDLSDSSDSGSGMNFPTGTGGKRKRSSRRISKRKAAESSLQSQGSPDEEQSSNDSESQRSDARRSLSDSIRRRTNKSTKNKAKRRATEIERIKGSGVPGTSKDASKPTKKSKNNVEPGANTSKRSLRQSTLGFQVRMDNTPGNDAPLSEITPSAVTSPAKQKSKSNVTVLTSHGFGTSTPVTHLNLRKKRFVVNDTTEMSPIKSKNNSGIK